MATDDLITSYVEDLDRALRGRVRHTERICAETDDHLRSTAEDLGHTGLAEGEAARRALECFGPVEQLAATFLTLEMGGAGARATRFTIRAGLLGALGGLIISIAAAQQVLTDAQTQSNDRGVGAIIGTAVLLIAIGLTGVGFVGIVMRHRGTLRSVDRVALGLLLAGLVAMWIPVWGIFVIAIPLMLAGTVLFGIRVYRVHALPRPPLAFMLLAGALVIGLTVTKANKSSVEYATGWAFVIAGWCWLQFTLWSERPERRPASA
jgi:hypothetical protein